MEHGVVPVSGGGGEYGRWRMDEKQASLIEPVGISSKEFSRICAAFCGFFTA